MILSKSYSRVIMGRRRVKEKLPGPALVKVSCYSAGQHRYSGDPADVQEIPAGDPLTKGSPSFWDIIDVDEEYDLPELKALVGKSVQIWTGDGWGSYHERGITVFVIAPGLPIGFTQEASDPKLVGEFPFRSLKQSCDEVVRRLGLRKGPHSDELPKLDVPETSESFVGEDLGKTPPISVETPYKPKKGETSQQYWDRLRDEETGKYHYKRSGD